MTLYTVHVEIHEDVDIPEKTEYNRTVIPASKRHTQIVNVTTRADTKEKAVAKAIALLGLE